ncbi:MAG TPA: VOC family protein [Rhizomicrobium sp.]|jgi:catechol 2,3-dioxygenase-like lactoylglutathione lyase family enzyme
MARITGIGGVFFKASDPKALAAWYRDTLGLPLEDWGGAMVKNEGPPQVVWSTFPADTKYFEPSAKPFMINYAVDDLDAFLAMLETKGVKALSRSDEGAMGLFAWIADPDGNKIELWQPAPE